MAKNSTRRALKRKIAECYTNLEKAATHLADTHPTFALHHPDLADMIETMAKEILVVQSQLMEFWVLCWGELPTSFDARDL